MKINYELLSFRYKKLFFLNRYKFQKIQSNLNNLNKGKHSFCPLCFGDEVDLISEVDRVGFQVETVVCCRCDFVFNKSYIDNPIEYYEKNFADNRWIDPEESFKRRTSDEAYSSKRIQFVKKTIGENFLEIQDILEVGCGDGCNLLPYHLIGKTVVGCDFNENFLIPGRKEGMDLILGDIKSIPKNKKFDLIMLIHSFEHFIDLDEIIKQVYVRLNPGGMVFVEVPGIFNWNQIKKEKKTEMGFNSSNNFMNYLQFEHNYHFDLDHLRFFWERNNFEIVTGDEWVRAIFKRKETNDNFKKSWNKLNHGIIHHLKLVEKDFLSIKNLIGGLIKLILRKLTRSKI